MSLAVFDRDAPAGTQARGELAQIGDAIDEQVIDLGEQNESIRSRFEPRLVAPDEARRHLRASGEARAKGHKRLCREVGSDNAAAATHGIGEAQRQVAAARADLGHGIAAAQAERRDQLARAPVAVLGSTRDGQRRLLAAGERREGSDEGEGDERASAPT